ncbi:MAG: hypothetical protein H6Q74_1504 [Firmicutes bacterium]|nr:hypothetical protein [Bacillota bacterium]
MPALYLPICEKKNGVNPRLVGISSLGLAVRYQNYSEKGVVKYGI